MTSRGASTIRSFPTVAPRSSFIVGVTTTPLHVAPQGAWETWGIRLRPGGIHGLLRIRASLTSNETITIDDLPVDAAGFGSLRAVHPA